VPERAGLAELEQQEALRRSARAAGKDAPAPVIDDAATLRPVAGGLGGGRAAAGGFPGAMSPATLMAMQHLAGNRATVQVVGRMQRPIAIQTHRPVAVQLQKPLEEEELVPADTGPGAETAGPKETGAAAGPPDGGATGGAGSPGGGASGGTGTPGGGASGGIGSPGGSASGSTTGGTGGSADVKPESIGGIAGALAGVAVGAAVGAASGGAGALAGAAAGAAASPPPPRTTEPPAILTGGGSGAGGTGQAAGGSTAEPTTGSTAGPAAGATAGLKPGAKPVAAPGGAAGPGPDAGAGSAPAPLPVPAGLGPTPAPATTGPGGAPDPETAKTGVDWNQILSDFGSPTRTVLEVGRLIPGWGLLAGLGADSINFAQDIAAIPTSENSELTTVLVVFRNLVNIGNNAVGHILYVDQLIQDGLAGSVVGAEFTPLTAAANEVLSSVKVGLDSVQMGTDIVIEVEALYESNHAPTSAEAEQWKQFADGYAANILGDIVNLTLDVISLASAGASNTAAVEEAKLPLTLAGAFLKKATPNIIGGLNGVIGVWLGNLVTEGRHAYEGSAEELRDQALAWDVAGGFVDAEGSQAQMTYSTVNFVIDQFAEYADQQVAQMDAVVGALTGGKSTFEVIRDSVNEGLQDMTRKLGMVEQLGSLASDAKTNTATISEACASILSALDALVVPTVTLPEVELGEGILADTAEAIANQAGRAANALIRQAIANVNAKIDGLKSEVRGPVEAVQEKADSIGEWLALLAVECETMASTLNGYITKFSDGLAKCTNVEQVIDLIIGQVSDLTGMPKFTVQEMRDTWRSVGGYIDRFVALGPQMHQRASDLRAHADLLESGAEAGPELAGPPEPPPGLPPGIGGGSPTGVGAGGPPGSGLGGSAAA
jgi:hypothetical protein